MPLGLQEYEYAAKILENISNKRSTLRLLSFADFPAEIDPRLKNVIYALVTQTMKCTATINLVINAAHIPIPKDVSPALSKILLYELLFGQGFHPSFKNKVANGLKILLSGSADYKSTFAELQTKKSSSNKVAVASPQSKVHIPVIVRYARVNTLQMSVTDVLSKLCNEHKFKQVASSSAFSSIGDEVCIDEHVSDVLVFPSRVVLHNLPLTTMHNVLLRQDKSSAFPVHALRPKTSWHVIDACSAPGFKTMHLSAMMKGEGQIFAFDMSAQRVIKMRRNLVTWGCKNVEATVSDWLKVNPLDPKYSKVKGILVDPSCSGSGTAFFHDTSQSPKQFGKQQKRLVMHSFEFPAVRRVVYSTCSVNVEENEHVVKKILKKLRRIQQEKAENGIVFPSFELVPVIPSWHRRGFPLFENAEHCLRTDPSEDNCLGFFVACFQRVVEGKVSGTGGGKLSPLAAVVSSSDDNSILASSDAKTDNNEKRKRKRNSDDGLS